MDTYPPQFIDEMKQRLLQQKAKLQEDLTGLSAHTELGDDIDDNAEEVAVDEVSRDLIARIRQDLEKIDRAMEKVEQGTYGYDANGKMIGEARLRVMPWADTAL